jgi:hypothetical protein
MTKHARDMSPKEFKAALAAIDVEHDHEREIRARRDEIARISI